MSVRAHRINKKEFENVSTWNLWSESVITDWLEENDDGFIASLNDGAGEIEVSVEGLEALIEVMKSGELKRENWTKEGKTFEKFTDTDIKAIQTDIDWAKEKGQEWVAYSCF